MNDLQTKFDTVLKQYKMVTCIKVIFTTFESLKKIKH